MQPFRNTCVIIVNRITSINENSCIDYAYFYFILSRFSKGETAKTGRYPIVFSGTFSIHCILFLFLLQESDQFSSRKNKKLNRTIK